MRHMVDLEALYDRLSQIKGRRGISRVKIVQLVNLLQAKVEECDVVYIRAKDIAKDSVHFSDPRYVGVCMSTLKEITPVKGIPFDVDKYSKSWRITRAPV